MTSNHKFDVSLHPNPERYIGVFEGMQTGPTLIFIAGIHGNEASGVFALEQIFKNLKGKKQYFKGKLIALKGNIKALEKGVRYIDKDLNRLFTESKIRQLNALHNYTFKEQKEQQEILVEIESILSKEKTPIYFFDLHTTSSETIPFITVNDSLLNRKFTKQYPLPLVLGIEEYLEGPLLSYINEKGYVAFGFEGGQHESKKATENHLSFIYLTLYLVGALSKDKTSFNHYYQKLLENVNGITSFFEIIYRHHIKENDGFKMKNGFQNFDFINNKEEIATNHSGVINSLYKGQIFMPLYQGKGNDGFFIVRKVPKVFLTLSKWLRNVKLDQVLVLLPGVNWKTPNKDSMIVDLRVARFFTKQFFHLMGYRNRIKDRNYLIVKNRERASKIYMYKKEQWF